MHEHINYFNTQSLEKMMAVAGVPGVQSGTYKLPGGLMGTVTLGWCMGMVAEEQGHHYAFSESSSAANTRTGVQGA